MFSGDVAEAVRHARTINKQIKVAQALDSTELFNYAKELRVPIDLLQKTAELGRLPVVNFAAGGIGKSITIVQIIPNTNSLLKQLKLQFVSCLHSSIIVFTQGVK